jgi:positive phototaxis protein PixI
MPVGVLGLINRRSRIFWLIDLAQLLGLQPLTPNLQQYNVALVRVGPAALGLAVQEVKGVARFPREAIQSLQGPTSSNLASYLQGMILQPAEVLLVLDGEAIARSPLLNNDLSQTG